MVKVSDGAELQAEFVLADCPTVSYTAEGLTIVSGPTTVVYPATSTHTFTLSDAAGITDTDIPRVDLSIEGATAVITGLPCKSQVRVLSPNGSLITASEADGTGRCEVSVPSGIFVVSTPNKTFKIKK